MSAYTGGTSALDLLRLRRMTAEAGSATYLDSDLIAAIQRYPLTDADGHDPDSAYWTPVYDLARAASEIWEEKAANVAANFAFDADGASFQKQQQFEQYSKQARLYNSRRTVGVWEAETVASRRLTPPQIANWNDPYE
jgi:hypothetical protein